MRAVDAPLTSAMTTTTRRQTTGFTQFRDTAGEKGERQGVARMWDEREPGCEMIKAGKARWKAGRG